MVFWAALLLFQSVLDSNAQQNAINNKFSCDGRPPGYYADIGTGCQVYHMCDGLGRQFSYSCPNTTLFQQRMLICDHWYMVNCSKSEVDYTANLLIGQREKLFVDDSDNKHPYHRTPRPDLLTHKADAENAIFRTGRAFGKTNLNVVGASTDGDAGDGTNSTSEAVYFLPSHWYIRYTKQPTQQDASNEASAKEGVVSYTPNTRRVPSTTTEAFKDRIVNSAFSPRTTEGTTEFPVNFKSMFKATTPVFPKVVQTSTTTSRPDDVTEFPVNFKSFFKNTTPSFPKAVDSDTLSLNVNEIGLLPPPTDDKSETAADDVQIPSTDFLPPAQDNTHLTRNRPDNVDIDPPSKFYQAPRFEPDYTSQQAQNENQTKRLETFIAESTTYSGDKQWKNLRRVFLIPEYEFPLETASRPGYDSKLSSFEVKLEPFK